MPCTADHVTVTTPSGSSQSYQNAGGIVRAILFSVCRHQYMLEQRDEVRKVLLEEFASSIGHRCNASHCLLKHNRVLALKHFLQTFKDAVQIRFHLHFRGLFAKVYERGRTVRLHTAACAISHHSNKRRNHRSMVHRLKRQPIRASSVRGKVERQLPDCVACVVPTSLR